MGKGYFFIDVGIDRESRDIVFMSFVRVVRSLVVVVFVNLIAPHQNLSLSYQLVEIMPLDFILIYTRL